MMAPHDNDPAENDLDNDGVNDEFEAAPLAVDEYEEELELADEEERLPWLETAEYDEDETGSDTGRIVGFALLALLALALLIGIIWWLSNRGPDPELAADGSTIAAPAGDYKERPEDPGGRDFAGSGDVAPAVGQGQTREGRLADDSGDGARPSVDVASSNSGTRTGGNSAGATSSGTASATEGVGVQVGAYSTRQSAVSGWAQLKRQTDALSGFKYRIIEGQADIGTVYRLQAVAGNAAAANQLCTALKGDGVQCQVKN